MEASPDSFWNAFSLGAMSGIMVAGVILLLAGVVFKLIAGEDED